MTLPNNVDDLTRTDCLMECDQVGYSVLRILKPSPRVIQLQLAERLSIYAHACSLKASHQRSDDVAVAGGTEKFVRRVIGCAAGQGTLSGVNWQSATCRARVLA